MRPKRHGWHRPPYAPTPEMADVRRRRLALGLKQSHLAYLAGCCRTRIVELESGRRRYSPEQLARLRRALEAEEGRETEF